MNPSRDFAVAEPDAGRLLQRVVVEGEGARLRFDAAFGHSC